MVDDEAIFQMFSASVLLTKGKLKKSIGVISGSLFWKLSFPIEITIYVFTKNS